MSDAETVLEDEGVQASITLVSHLEHTVQDSGVAEALEKQEPRVALHTVSRSVGRSTVRRKFDHFLTQTIIDFKTGVALLTSVVQGQVIAQAVGGKVHASIVSDHISLGALGAGTV